MIASGHRWDTNTALRMRIPGCCIPLHGKLLLLLPMYLLLLLMVVVSSYLLLMLELPTHLARVHSHISLLLILMYLHGRVGVVRGESLLRVTSGDSFHSCVLQRMTRRVRDSIQGPTVASRGVL